MVVHEQDFYNSPIYYDVDFVEGRTYRFRGWAGESVHSLMMILADPGGTPIRRAMTSLGNTLDKSFEQLNMSRLNALHRDAGKRCVGDTAAEIIYKATETAVYKIGVGQATDSRHPRSNYESDLDFSFQWRGSALDTGQLVGCNVLGDHPANGTLRLKVETIELPPLPSEEQAAMLELQSPDGVSQPEFLGYHTSFPNETIFTVNTSSRVFLSDEIEPFWNRDEHPCTWGGRHSGMDVGCCLRSDADGGAVVSAAVTMIDLNIWSAVCEWSTACRSMPSLHSAHIFYELTEPRVARRPWRHWPGKLSGHHSGFYRELAVTSHIWSRRISHVSALFACQCGGHL